MERVPMTLRNRAAGRFCQSPLTTDRLRRIRKSSEDASFLQRLTPRRARSNWSQKNVQHAERLMEQGRMQAAGLAQVEAARSDGRWATAYAGSATMVMPEDFLTALQQDPRCPCVLHHPQTPE